MLKPELECKRDELMSDMEHVVTRMKPLEEELKRIREHLDHVVRLLQLENGQSPRHGAQIVIPRKPSGEPHWQAGADLLNHYVGTNSAHRVLMKKNRVLHDATPHLCGYDGRSYP